MVKVVVVRVYRPLVRLIRQDGSFTSVTTAHFEQLQAIAHEREQRRLEMRLEGQEGSWRHGTIEAIHPAEDDTEEADGLVTTIATASIAWRIVLMDADRVDVLGRADVVTEVGKANVIGESHHRNNGTCGISKAKGYGCRLADWTLWSKAVGDGEPPREMDRGSLYGIEVSRSSDLEGSFLQYPRSCLQCNTLHRAHEEKPQFRPAIATLCCN